MDSRIGPNLPPDKARMLAYRLAKFEVERHLKEVTDQIVKDAGPGADGIWVRDALGAVQDDLEGAAIDPSTRPKGMLLRDAKALAGRVGAYRQQFLDELKAQGHVEHHDDRLTHDVHGEAYERVARRLNEVLGVKGIGWRMRCDTAGPGLVVVADAALHGKDTLADVAAVYRDAAAADREWIARDRVYWDAPAFEGGPLRRGTASADAAKAEGERAGRRLELARERLEVAERLEACGHDGGAAVWRGVVDASVEDVRRWEVVLGELAVARRLEEEKQEAARQAAEATRREAVLRRDELALQPVAAKRGEEVFRLRVGDRWHAWTGTLHHGAYAISRPPEATTPAERRTCVVTHLASGKRIGHYSTRKHAVDVVERLCAELPELGAADAVPLELQKRAWAIVAPHRL